MTRRYDFITIDTTGPDAIAAGFANQAVYCRANDAPVTARIVDAIWAVCETPACSAFLDRIRSWTGAPLADALPLRAAGGLHALHLAGQAPELAPIYADQPGIDDAAILAGVIERHHDALMPWLDGPPQTNEAGRSANFIAALLWLAERGLPADFECIEIGSSAGINLMIDRYHYTLGGVAVGPAESPMRFAPEWQGPPPPSHPIHFAAIRGSDIAPVDLTDPVQALRLKAYIWPEHTERFARMETAIAMAQQQKPDLVASNAADFAEAQLALPQAAGTTRVLMHSIMWQYVPADQQARVTAAMEAAGARATADRPLAWVALEANRTVHHHELIVRYWPGDGAPHLLTRAHAHGAWLQWVADAG